MPWYRNKETEQTPPYKRSMRLGCTEGSILHDWLGSGTNDTVTVSADVLYALPIFLPETIRVAQLTCEVITGSAGNIRMSLYRDLNGYPDSLVTTETEITTAATAGIKSQSISKTLPCGFYWAAITFSSTPEVRSNIISNCTFWLGHTDMNDVVGHTGISVARAYAALPSTFTAGATLLATDTPRVLMVIGKYGTLP